MEAVRKIEKTMAGWYGNVPHLPPNIQKWLADNVWWLAGIGAILGAIAFLGVVSASFLGGAVIVGLGGPVGAAVAGFAFIAVVVSLLSLGFLTVLSGMAVAPLKEHKKKGWELLFISELVYVAFAVLGVLFGGDGNVIGTAISIAIGFYLLFEIRGHFDHGVKHDSHKKEHTEEKKA